MIVNFSVAHTYQALVAVPAAELIQSVKAFCLTGRSMHPEALKNAVLTLTSQSRNLSLKQLERDEAADMATMLANAAIRTYGQNSAFGMDLIAGIHAIAGRDVA